MDTATTPPGSTRARLARGQQAYLNGRYDEAVAAMGTIAVTRLPLTPLQRKACRYLSLAYFQLNQYEEAARLPGNDALSKLMRSFPAAPYQIDWSGRTAATLEFLQEHAWELPRIEIQANGTSLPAKIDTGGDLLSLPWQTARGLGVSVVATQTGWFAGGRRAATGKGILNSLQLGGVRLTNVPVSINSFDHAIVGTGLLRQFSPTLDYPRHRLVLSPRGSTRIKGTPIRLAATHLIIADGQLNGVPVSLLVDSGLEVSTGGSLVAPARTLEAAGISPTSRAEVEGMSGAGRGRLRIGEFTAASVTLAGQTRTGVTGLTGIFPPQLVKSRTVGIPVHAIISHGFLRHYAWTIDFDQMKMDLAAP